jgi:hypothetical protein
MRKLLQSRRIRARVIRICSSFGDFLGQSLPESREYFAFGVVAISKTQTIAMTESMN